MPDLDKHGSHIPLLIKAVQRTNGHFPVVELGVGYNSTPLLHWLTFDLQRLLYSFDNDKVWLDRFLDYQSTWHVVKHVEDWNFLPCDHERIGVLLVDMRPALERHRQAIKFANKADIVLVHDSEPEIDKFYAYRRVWPHFKYRYDYNRVKPYTTALSNTIDVAKELA